LQERLRRLPKGKEYVAYCRGPYCVYADRAVELLRANGRRARRMLDGFPEWKAAGLPIEDAAAGMSARDRALLRLHLVERASIDDVAAVYRVHRATAARWIQTARETLTSHTRKNFLAGADLDTHDEAGLASLVESQLTLSLSRILL